MKRGRAIFVSVPLVVAGILTGAWLWMGADTEAPRRAEAAAEVPLPGDWSALPAEIRAPVEEAARLCRVRPGDPEPMAALALLYHANAQPVLAAAAYQRALALGAGGAQVPYLLGFLCLEGGRPEQALVMLDLSIARHARYAPAHERRGLALLDLARIDEAVAALEHATRVDPACAACFSGLGKAYRQAGRLGDAEAALRQALRLDPEDGAAHQLLGLTLMGLGEPAAARPHLERLRWRTGDVRSDPWLRQVQQQAILLEVKLDLAESFLASGMAESAVRHLLDVSRDHRDEPEVFRLLGRAHLAAGAAQEAADAYVRAAALDPGDPRAHAALAAILLEHGLHEDAERECRLALSADPAHVQALLVQGTLAVQRKRYQEAADILGPLAERRPDFFAASLWLAEALAGLDRLDEALVAYRRAVALDPAHEFARRRLREAEEHLRAGGGR
jgi:tetratricopeptide (TPR) repeat protein